MRLWFAERLPLAEVEAAIQHKTVPQHRHSVWYYLGGMTLFFFGVQVVTGILLLLYYRPSSAEAYDSVQFIMTRVPFGWLIRSIHSWSANLMVGCRVRAHVQRHLPQGVPAPAGDHLAQRRSAAVPGTGFRIHGLSAAVERAVVLRHARRHGHRRRRPRHRRVHRAIPSRRQGHQRRDADALLWRPRRRASRNRHGIARFAPACSCSTTG